MMTRTALSANRRSDGYNRLEGPGCPSSSYRAVLGCVNLARGHGHTSHSWGCRPPVVKVSGSWSRIPGNE
jgi:hypothetical protein